MTEPHDDRTPVEHDPTGMRALLANLPDPGPMPEHLVARITAALAAEADAVVGTSRRRRATGIRPDRGRRARARHPAGAAPWGADAAPGGRGGGRRGPGPHRGRPHEHRRRPHRLDRGRAGHRGVGPGRAERRGRDSGGTAGGAESPATSPLVPPVGSGEVRIVMSGRAYAASALPDGVEPPGRGHGRGSTSPRGRGPRHRSDRHPCRGPHVRHLTGRPVGCRPPRRRGRRSTVARQRSSSSTPERATWPTPSTATAPRAPLASSAVRSVVD